MISLMNHINSDRENPFLALAFSGRDELVNYLAEKEIDVLLLDQELLDDEVDSLTRGKYIVLTKSRLDADDEHQSGVCTMFKYSKVRDVVQRITEYLEVDDSKQSPRVFRSYGVISPIGRCGKTNLAISLCMNDEVRGGLYIGLEEFSSFEDTEDVISNVIYLAKERSCGFVEYVENHIVKLDDYSVLGYMQSYMDALEITREDMVWMLDRLKEWGRYTSIVFDLGQAVLKDLSVLSAFDEVFVPQLADEQSMDKIGAFDRLLESEELGKVLRCMRKVILPNTAPGSPEMYRFIEKQLGDRN